MVMLELIYLVAKVVESGRQLKLNFSQHYSGYYAFGSVFTENWFTNNTGASISLSFAN